jgi:poly-gamma-glutamate synthase PgsB/CapB
MTAGDLALITLIVVGVAVFAYWAVSMRAHRRRLDQLAVRVHVNGIRGKSTVTRLVAAVLREGGYVTVAKTTGSAARVIGPHGEEEPIARRGAATINEQVDIVERHVTEHVEALVIECMAVRPLYQQYAQDHMIRSDITIITNVREDHQEAMGETLEEIADAMSLTIPRGGILIAAEHRPHLRERLRRNAERRGSQLIYADPDAVGDNDMQGFDYLQFRENVAIGLAVARLLDIPRPVALRGMWKSVPDVGVVRLRHYDIGGKRILWIPLFATNDRESVILIFEQLKPHFPPGAPVIGILNNRSDRGRRAELFADMVPRDLARYLDRVITFGAYEQQVTRRIVDLGYDADRIVNLGESVNPSLDDILAAIVRLVPGEQGVLVGMVNIHTPQAELLLHHFDSLRGSSGTDELDASREPSRLPTGPGRLRRARAHPALRRGPRAGA